MKSLKLSLILLSSLSIFLGLYLRLYNITHIPLGFDEMIQFDLLWKVSSLRGVLHYNLIHDYQFPLQYLIVYPMVKVWGNELLAYRFFSLLFSLGGGVVLWRLLKEVSSKKQDQIIHFFVLALYSLSLPLIEYSYSSRPYGGLIFFTLMSFYLGYKSISDPTYKKHIWILCLFTLSLTHLFGLFMAIILFFQFWFLRLKQYPNPPMSIFRWSLVLIVLCFISLVGIYLVYIPALEIDIQRLVGFRKLLGLFSYLGNGISLILLFSFLLYRNKARGVKIFVYPILLLLLISLALNLIGLPSFEYRFFVGMIPLIFIVMGECIRRYFFGQKRKQIVMLMSLFVFVGSLLSHSQRVDKNPPVDLLVQDQQKIHEEQIDIVACGNCPSFYFLAGKQRLQCLRGWDFSQNTEALETMQGLIIFDLNQKYCQKFIPRDFKLKKKYSGFSYFSK